MSKGSNRQCMAGYARILARFAQEPMSAAQVIEQTGLTRDNANRLLSEMHRSQLIRIIDWDMPHNKVVAPIYCFGAGPDAEAPKKRPDGKPCKPRKTQEKPRRSNFMAFLSIWRSLEDGCVSRRELAEECGVNRATVERVIVVLKRSKLIYRSGWDTSVRPYVELFTVGKKSDAKKPKSQCRKVLNRLYRQRKKESAPISAIYNAFAANDERQAA
jgi:DNA-binding transcriptional regulator YhcF (GntR family)